MVRVDSRRPVPASGGGRLRVVRRPSYTQAAGGGGTWAPSDTSARASTCADGMCPSPAPHPPPPPPRGAGPTLGAGPSVGAFLHLSPTVGDGVDGRATAAHLNAAAHPCARTPPAAAWVPPPLAVVAPAALQTAHPRGELVHAQLLWWASVAAGGRGDCDACHIPPRASVVYRLYNQLHVYILQAGASKCSFLCACGFSVRPPRDVGRGGGSTSPRPLATRPVAAARVATDAKAPPPALRACAGRRSCRRDCARWSRGPAAATDGACAGPLVARDAVLAAASSLPLALPG